VRTNEREVKLRTNEREAKLRMTGREDTNGRKADNRPTGDFI
jgi:hypothetical protein